MPDTEKKTSSRIKSPADVGSLARAHTAAAIKVLAGIATGGTNEGAKVSASIALLDRGWGKASQPITGNATINVILRKGLGDE